MSPTAVVSASAANLPALPDHRTRLVCSCKAKAEIACFVCKSYICRVCDVKNHVKPEASGHYRRLVSEMLCYVAFDQPGEPRRDWMAAKQLYAEFNGRETSYRNFYETVKAVPNNPFLGSRRRVADKEGDLRAGEYVWKTYGQVAKIVGEIANGMQEIGLKPYEKVGIYMLNREEWVIAEQASFCFSNVTVPLYDTLGHETIQYVANQSEMKMVFVSENKLPVLSRALKNCTTLKYIIVVKKHDFAKMEQGAVEIDHSRFKVVKFDELQSLGAKAPLRPHVPPKTKDVCTICYTSGTTGDPKGVIVTHGSFLANYGALIYRGIKFYANDVHISFLPLPHMFERIVQLGVVEGGSRMGFFRGDTTLLLDDIANLRPTVFSAVPRLYNRIHGKILNQVESGGAVKKWLFNSALAAKIDGLKRGTLTHSVWDPLVFSKLKQALGGRVRLMCSGAAPISANVMQFLRVGFSCPVIEGYGMTETCSGGTITNVDDYNVLGNVGSPLPSVEIKLADVPEMDYRSADMLNGVPHPRGEICFRGPGISLGYYNMPEQTKDAIDSEGWLHSGDIGVWLPEQGLKIIDRKKNIFKLSQGEYVAPEKIENIYQRSSFVAQAFVYGNSLEPSLVAILIPDEEFLVPWAEKNGFGKLDLKSLCAKPEIKKIIFNDLLKVSQAGGLHGFEICKAIHLDHVLFSMENDLLTPTMKLKRNVASDKYKDVIAQMYKDLSGQKQAQLSSKL